MPEDSRFRVKLGILVLSLISLVIFSSYIFRGPFKGLASPAFNFSSNFVFEFANPGLSKVVQENISGQDGEYAIYIEDLVNEDKYSLNGTEIFPAASFYKLYLMTATLKEVEQGNLKLDSKVSASKEHLEKVFGGVDFGYEDAPENIGYTVKEALIRIGRISDNFAALLLAEKIGWDKVQQLADELGLKDTQFKNPITTTAFDTATFFKKLYAKEVVSPQVSEGVIEFLSLNQLNNRIPAGMSIKQGSCLESGMMLG